MQVLLRLGGVLLVLAALGLSLPGVRIARAEGLASPAQPSGPMCRAGEPPNSGVALERLTEALRARAAAESADGAPRVVNLNTRGYNYRTRAHANVDAALLAREIELQHR